MKAAELEQALLKLAFESEVELTPASVAYHLGCTVEEAKRQLEALLEQNVLMLDSDDDGNLLYVLPERKRGDATAPVLAKQARSVSTTRKSGRENAVAATALNALIPGSGSLLAGRWLPAGGQALLALTPAFFIFRYWKDFGDSEHVPKLVLLIAAYLGAWIWALRTSLSLWRDDAQAPTED